MKVNPKLRIFSRVLRSYSIEESILSIILVAIVLFFGSQLFGDLSPFKTAFADNNSYTEALVSDKALTLNPVFVDIHEPSRDVSRLIFSGLTKYDPQTKSFVADLANFSLSEDYKTYHFTLKDGLMWQDGEPITIQDVYYTFHDVIQSPDFQNNILKSNFDGVEIKIIDEKSIDFVLKSPNSFFITNTSIGLLPKHILGTSPVKDLLKSSFNLKPIGNGPYKVENQLELFEDGRQRVNLHINEKYYGDKPKIQQIRMRIYPDFETLVHELSSIDIVAKVPAREVPNFQKDSKFQFLNYELPQYTGLFFNLDNAVLKKEKVRVALVKSIDKQELLKLFTDKIAVDTPLLELNQSDWIYKANQKEAEGALFDAGYKINASIKEDTYRRDKAGNVLEIKLLIRSYDPSTTAFEETQKLTNFLQQSWGKIGIKLTIVSLPELEYKAAIQERGFDMVLAGQSLGYNLDTYVFWHSTQAVAGGLNISNYRSYAADQIIELIRDTFDPAMKDKRLKDLAKVLADDLPAIFLYRPKYVFATDARVQHLDLQNLAVSADRFENVTSWCINCAQ